jgi:hypothetical protein
MGCGHRAEMTFDELRLPDETIFVHSPRLLNFVWDRRNSAAKRLLVSGRIVNRQLPHCSCWSGTLIIATKTAAGAAVGKNRCVLGRSRALPFLITGRTAKKAECLWKRVFSCPCGLTATVGLAAVDQRFQSRLGK